MKSPEIIVILIVVVLLYCLVSAEDDTTQTTITLEDKCELVLRNQQDMPKQIIDQCKKLLKENDDE